MAGRRGSSGFWRRLSRGWVEDLSPTGGIFEVMFALVLAAQLSAGAIVVRAKEVDLRIEDLQARARMEIVV